MKAECIVTGGKQMSGILKSITARSVSDLVYTRVNTHLIYIDPDYTWNLPRIKFTRIEIVSYITTSILYQPHSS